MKRRIFIKSLLATLVLPFAALFSRPKPFKCIYVGGAVDPNDPLADVFDSVTFDGSGTVCTKDATGALTGTPHCTDLRGFTYNYETGLVEHSGPAFATEDGINPDWESPC